MTMPSFSRLTALAIIALCFSIPGHSQTRLAQANPAAGPGNIIVQGRLRGIIAGFDIDPNGNEGLLSEFKGLSDGTVLAAVETFDQTTGEILKVITRSMTQDDFVTLGISGNSVGLVEREHVISLFHVERTFRVLNPLTANRLTGAWKPPLDQKHIINEVKGALGNSEVAVYAIDVSSKFTPVVFESDIGANTFGPVIPVTDTDLNFENAPVLAFDSVNHRAILGHATNSPFIVPPTIGIVDLTTGAFSKFTGLGLGLINGIAVDSEDGILCTTTSFDASVQFYDLATQTGTSQFLPGASEQDSLFRGQHIEYDSVNKLFLIAQPFTSTGTSGSSIQVYDTKGNFVESIDGLSFSGTSNVFPVHIALHPSQRSGFVDGPDLHDKQIQSFTY